jgi:hypothetical protein
MGIYLVGGPLPLRPHGTGHGGDGDTVKLKVQGRYMVPMMVVKYGGHLQSLECQGGIHMKPIRFVFSSLMYSMQHKLNNPVAS